MDIQELLQHIPRCNVRQGEVPFWRCSLPRGHRGDHASIALRPWAA